MNGAYKHLAERWLIGCRCLDFAPDALFQFGGSMFGESEGYNGRAVDSVDDHLSHPAGERFCLATTGAGEDK